MPACDAQQLVDFAVMGEAFARAIFGIERPTVGLLNIGEEEMKGIESVKRAGQILRACQLPMEFCGFIEGDDIGEGVVDVVVTDGFTGNVALKTAEGTAKLIVHWLRSALKRSMLGRLGALLASGALKGLQRKLDPRTLNGGVFLGLNGVVVKSHGGADALGFASAIDLAIDMGGSDMIARILADRAGVSSVAGRRRSGRSSRRVRCGQGGCLVNLVRSVVLGCGSYLPGKILTNFDLAKMVDTTDEWIVERTGIKSAAYCPRGRDDIRSRVGSGASAPSATPESAVDEIDLVIVATTTPDETFPSTATRVQARLNMLRGAAFDIQAVCSGFIYAISVADAMIRSGQAKTVLVIGAETMSRLLDWSDRGTCVLFGDGAGAVVLQAQEGAGTVEDRGVLGNADLFRRTTARSALCRWRRFHHGYGGPSADAGTRSVQARGDQYLRRPSKSAAREAGVALSDIDWFVPHQANQRILDGTARKLGISPERVISTVAEHGNTSAASVPLALVCRRG